MPDYNRSQFIAVDLKEGVATITMNRPDRLNAIGGDMHETLEELFVELDHDPEVRAILVTGAGRAFCAGGDVKDMDERQRDPSRRRVAQPTRGGRVLVRNMLECDTPIVAAVNGDAVGLGATIALLCDVVFMAENARIGDRHISVGLVAGDGGAVIWPHLVGPSRAKHFLMTGDMIPGREAERIGLVSFVTPAGKAQEEGWKYAKRLADGPVQAIKWTKYSVNKVLRDTLNLNMDIGLALEGLSFMTDDHKEAARAFVEKRAPTFKGR
ncbi:MAG: enoyl-CoA hydratase/isomerase family protein [Chloroflexi bacterium]|nr:enoyl-CoA hydratase/isomerase family protein [Chloroflexota bacterium]